MSAIAPSQEIASKLKLELIHRSWVALTITNCKGVPTPGIIGQICIEHRRTLDDPNEIRTSQWKIGDRAECLPATVNRSTCSWRGEMEGSEHCFLCGDVSSVVLTEGSGDTLEERLRINSATVRNAITDHLRPTFVAFSRSKWAYAGLFGAEPGISSFQLRPLDGFYVPNDWPGNRRW